MRLPNARDFASPEALTRYWIAVERVASGGGLSPHLASTLLAFALGARPHSEAPSRSPTAGVPSPMSTIRALIACGADVRGTCPFRASWIDSPSMLHLAAMQADGVFAAGACSALCAAGADVHALALEQGWFEEPVSALHVAATTPAVLTLLAAGADAARGEGEISTLSCPAAQKNAVTCAALLAAGAKAVGPFWQRLLERARMV